MKTVSLRKILLHKKLQVKVVYWNKQCFRSDYVKQFYSENFEIGFGQ